MPSFNFETGLKTFDINGDSERTISFPPSDAKFVRRVYEGLGKLEECQKRHRAGVEAITEPSEILDAVDAADGEIREIIDGVFESPVCDAVFGNLNTCGVAAGMPLWAGFMVALASECDDYLSAQEKAKNPKLDKLLAKYKK